MATYEPLSYLDDDAAAVVVELAAAVMATFDPAARPVPISSGLLVDVGGSVIDGDLETAVREIVARALLLRGEITQPAWPA